LTKPSSSEDAAGPVGRAIPAAGGLDAASPPPGQADGPIVRVVTMTGSSCRDLEGEAGIEELRRAAGSRGTRIWVDVTTASPSILAEIGGILDLHPLLVEDLAERDQRAKLERIGDVTHLVLFGLAMDGGTTYERELDFVIGPHFLLTSHSRWWNPRTTHQLRGGFAPVVKRGLDYLLWALCDDTIDGYFPILDRLGDEIDELEDRVVGSADRELLERLFELKRELIQIRRVTAPEREMFNLLSSRDETHVTAEIRLYFRDAYDHLIRLTDEIDTYRELASAALETYLSTVNNNLSLIMKRLTGVTVVVAGIGAIAGIFGMSEAQSAFRWQEGSGFWLVTFGCVVLAVAAAWVLHKLDWI
jgi:magnesium transporter